MSYARSPVLQHCDQRILEERAWHVACRGWRLCEREAVIEFGTHEENIKMSVALQGIMHATYFSYEFELVYSVPELKCLPCHMRSEESIGIGEG